MRDIWIFDPDGPVTYAEALTIVARVHSILNTGSSDAADHYQERETEPWYWTYAAYTDKFLGNYDFSSYESPASRLDFARLLGVAVGNVEAEINEIAENAIRDLIENTVTEGIYRLYRAGILTKQEDMRIESRIVF